MLPLHRKLQQRKTICTSLQCFHTLLFFLRRKSLAVSFKEVYICHKPEAYLHMYVCIYVVFTSLYIELCLYRLAVLWLYVSTWRLWAPKCKPQFITPSYSWGCVVSKAKIWDRNVYFVVQYFHQSFLNNVTLIGEPHNRMPPETWWPVCNVLMLMF